MKILSLSNHSLLPHLGSGKTRIKWTEGLRNLGHEVVVLQPYDFELYSSFKKAKKFRYALGAYLKVKHLLKKDHFDLIEFYGDEFWLAVLLISQKSRRPVLVAHADGLELLDMEKEEKFFNKRSGYQSFFFNLTHKKFSEIAFRNADKFVCGCNDDRKYAVENNIFKEGDAIQISPGIDDIFLNQEFIPQKEKKIVFIGSWIDRKGIKIIPEVISAVLKKFQDYEFHIFGSFGMKETILKLFNPGIRNRIIIHEKYPLEEMVEKIKKCSIFFLPSYSEGFGLSTAEAMACSCAAVVTPTGFCSEAPKNTLMVCPFDESMIMIESIEKLIEDESFRVSIAKNGFDLVKKYEWEKQVDLLDYYYRSWNN